MFVDVEEALGRELHEVADGLTVPPMPSLPQEQPRSPRHWQPLLVAAAVVLILAGAVVVVASARGGREPQPTPPSPTRTESVERIPRSAPTVPYVLDQHLYVGGAQVPGTWWSVQSGDAGWLALRTDNTWWWGRDAEPMAIEARLDVPPVLSPDGKYVGEVLADNGRGTLSGFDTGFNGEGLGGVPIDLGDPQDGSTVRVRAVTDDGRVIAQGTNTAVLWLPLVDNSTVDLSETAPGQQVLANTPAGLIVNDGAAGAVDATVGEPYLAQLSDTGELTRIGPVPNHDDLLVSPGGTWLAWTPAGTTGGEITAIPTLRTQAVDGSRQATLSAPDGWAFRVRAWAWEDDDRLVSPVVRDGAERMARCSVRAARCVLVDSR
ncbi:hypothetical protein GCM10009844_20270 [Nocardioides koreensis]|uniref:Uncharacterized protein n=1 Tax=Nocardioides koreensis TaxID=433651 RepID=A0ABN2ZQE2_9ACTN